MLIDVIFAAVLILIAVQLFDGMQSKMRSGQTTFLLQFPIWWSYAASFAAACVAGLVSIYCAIARVLDVTTGSELMPTEEGTKA